MSLILLLVVLMVIIYAVIKVGGQGSNMFRNKARWLTIGYFSVLIVAVVGYFVIVMNHDLWQGPPEGSINPGWEGTYYDFQQIVEDRALDTTEGIVKAKDWSFTVMNGKLAVKSASYHEIFAEIIPGEGSVIEVSSYKAPSQMAGIDITERIAPPRVELIDQEVLLIEPVENRFTGAGFTRSFVDSQFTKQGKESWGEINQYVNIGAQILYIRIPESVTLEDPSEMIQVVKGHN